MEAKCAVSKYRNNAIIFQTILFTISNFLIIDFRAMLETIHFRYFSIPFHSVSIQLVNLMAMNQLYGWVFGS